MELIDVIHKPSGLVKKLNQTHANRLLEYSAKGNGAWALVGNKEVAKPSPEPIPEKVNKKKKDKDEKTRKVTGSSDPE